RDHLAVNQVFPGLTDTNTNGATAARPGRLAKFSERYNEYFPRVFAYVYGRVHNVHVTEDLVADVFERAFVKADTLRNSEAFSTWLFTIARNVIISNGRKRSRETVVDPDILKEIAASGASVEGEVINREDVKAIALLLREFPQREQDIVALKFDAELSNTQIAKIMGMSEVNVRVILFRTLRKLRESMSARAGR
ncbi:MAG: RNA polymerase sigma factor, partial [Dehalococcoidia bacterium]